MWVQGANATGFSWGDFWGAGVDRCSQGSRPGALAGAPEVAAEGLVHSDAPEDTAPEARASGPGVAAGELVQPGAPEATAPGSPQGAPMLAAMPWVSASFA